MSLETRKISLAQWILNLQKEDVISKLEELASSFKNTQNESISFELSEDQKQELDKRRKDATDDDFMSINESNELLKKKYGL